MTGDAFHENLSEGAAGGPAGSEGWRRDSGAWLRQHSAWATALAAGVIVLATAAAFSNSFTGPFILDDIDAVTNNPTIRQLWPIGKCSAPRSKARRSPAGRC